jgi:hypothetical protein
MACVRKAQEAQEAQAAGRVSNTTGLLIRMLRDNDHHRLGRPAGERCLVCGNPQAEDFSRFNGGSPLLCALHAGLASPGGELRSFAELAEAEAAPG